ncbi:MAG TPA: hypothetical protein VNM22_21675 [Candidatus Limnocylindrales bacterium]|nr:hypothetical protein [Candidatus Limnocylindrales bacterium]
MIRKSSVRNLTVILTFIFMAVSCSNNSPTAPRNPESLLTSQGEDIPIESFTESFKSQSVKGVIDAVTPNPDGTLTISVRDKTSGNDVSILVTNQTHIFIGNNNRPGTIADIKVGEHVNVKYKVVNGQNVATTVHIHNH